MRRRSSQGFSLIELMVVVAIIGIMTVMIVPEFSGTYQDLLLRAASRELVSAARLASSQAVASGEPCRLCVDPSRGRFWLESSSPDSEGGFAPLERVPGSSGEIDHRVQIEVAAAAQAGQSTDGPRDPRPAAAAEGAGTGRGRELGSERSENIVFRADGTADPRTLVLRDDDGFGLLLRIHPITAKVRVEPIERRALR